MASEFHLFSLFNIRPWITTTLDRDFLNNSSIQNIKSYVTMSVFMLLININNLIQMN